MPITHAPAALPTLSIDEVMRDLESGRSLPVRPIDRLLALPARRRSQLGGPLFVATFLAARVLGRIHPRLARRALLRLWFTPWVHASANQPVINLDDDLSTWRGRVDGSVVPGGRTLRGYAGGSGPTVVLVHGWSGRAADWRHLAHDLINAGYRVVVPDLPAHGATAGRRTDLFELGRALASVLRQERPVAVVTHSMGFPMSMVALEQGAVAPMAMVAIAPGRRAERALSQFVAQAQLRPALERQLRLGIEARFGSEIWDVFDVDRMLPTLPSGGLVVHDDGDTDVPVEDGRAIAAAWTDARFIETDGLGHRHVMKDATVRRTVVEHLVATLS